MIDMSVNIDRIAVLYDYGKLVDDINSFEDETDYKIALVTTVLEQLMYLIKILKPNAIEVERVGNQFNSEIYLIENDERVPLMNIGAVPYQYSLRFDTNPKRITGVPWIEDIIHEFSDFMMSDMELTARISQVDLAFDVFDKVAENATYVKSGVRQTALFSDRTGRKQSVYYGQRASSGGYVRAYDKNAERIQEFNRMYNRKLKRILYRYETYTKNFIGTLTSDDVLNDFSYLELDICPYGGDLSIYSDFADAVKYVLDLKKSQDKSDLPEYDRRIEFVMRADRLDNGHNSLNDEAVMTELNCIHLNNLESISDPILRSVTVAVDNGIVDPTTLPTTIAKQRRQILKHGKIAQFRHNGNLKVMAYDKFISIPQNQIDGAIKIITMSDDKRLRDDMISCYYENKVRLNNELSKFVF